MGDGRYDRRAPDRCDREERASEHPLRHGGARAETNGAMINAVMLGASPAAAACRSRRKHSRRRSAPTARRSRAICAVSAPGSRRRVDASAGRTEGEKRREPRRRCRVDGTRNSHVDAGRGAGRDARRRAAARRLSGCRLCAALSRSPGRDPRRGRTPGRRRKAAARNRAPPRRAHVLRGRDPRRAGQDRPGAACAHRKGTERRRRSALSRSSSSSSPASRNCARSCRRGWRVAFSGCPNSAAGSTACTWAWKSRPPRSPAICASGCWRSCAAGAAGPSATRRSRRRSKPG